MLLKIDIFRKGLIDIAPLLIPVIPFGIIFGAIGIELGFSPLITYATSLIIFGGASQIVFVQLLSYYVANDLGKNIDKPRNLAKSVTVE